MVLLSSIYHLWYKCMYTNVTVFIISLFGWVLHVSIDHKVLWSDHYALSTVYFYTRLNYHSCETFLFLGGSPFMTVSLTRTCYIPIQIYQIGLDLCSPKMPLQMWSLILRGRFLAAQMVGVKYVKDFLQAVCAFIAFKPMYLSRSCFCVQGYDCIGKPLTTMDSGAWYCHHHFINSSHISLWCLLWKGFHI